jgi:hypothetical protein
MTMDNLTFIQVPNIDGTIVEHALIHHGEGFYTSMPKSTYDEMIEAQDEATVI